IPPGAMSVISSARAAGATNNTARTALDDNRCLMDGHSRSGARPERYRLFIAIALPEPVRHAIEKAQDGLRAALPERSIRWTRSDQFHLTLRFLGGVEAQRLEPLSDAVRRACAGAGVLQLRAARMGMFPGPRRPRVVWTGVDDTDGRLAELQRSIEAVTNGLKDEPPQAKFTGHVTLARCVDIIRSHPEPQGSIYTTLATIELD